MGKSLERSTETWFVKSQGKVRGPLVRAQLVDLCASGRLASDDLVSSDRNRWHPANDLMFLNWDAPPLPALPVPAATPVVRVPPLPHGRATPVASNLVVPGAVAGAATAGYEAYFYSVGDAVQGPISLSDLKSLATSGKLLPTDLVWRVGTTDWLAANQVSTLRGYFPRPTTRGRSSATTAILACAGCALLVLCLALLWRPIGDSEKKNRKANDDVSPEPRAVVSEVTTSTTISGLADENIERAVGLVVCGIHAKGPGGDIVELPLNRGSCFCVSDRGYLLTNKHVVEHAAEFQTRNPTGRDIQGVAVSAVVWVFFGANEKHPAEIVYQFPEVDLAILQVPRAELPCFRVSKRELQRGEDVFACGFPAIADEPLTDWEQIETNIRRKSTHANVREAFKSRDFIFTSTKGAISRVGLNVDGDDFFQHTATLHPGNSGGPLVSREGLVHGINTLRIPDKADLNYAISLTNLRKELDIRIPGIRWE